MGALVSLQSLKTVVDLRRRGGILEAGLERSVLQTSIQVRLLVFKDERRLRQLRVLLELHVLNHVGRVILRDELRLSSHVVQVV